MDREVVEAIGNIEETVDRLEEKLDELLDLARSQGLVSSGPPPVEYDDQWADPYAGGGGL